MFELNSSKLLGISEKNKIVTNLNFIPDELKKINNWICFKVTWNSEKEKFDKIPKNPHSSHGAEAKVNNSQTWSIFKKACFASQKFGYETLGFVFDLKSEVFGIDIDNCIVNGKISDDARFIVDTMNSYTEISPSGKGLHILAFGKIPDGKRRNKNVEMYCEGRGFTVTGNVFENFKKIEKRTDEVKIIHEKFLCVKEFENKIIFEDKKIAPKSNEFCLKKNKKISFIIDVEKIKNKMFDPEKNKNSEKCKKLFAGDISEYNSQSEADQAFVNILSYWCDKNEVLIDKIFRSSALYREKWDKKIGDKTYAQITIQNAINSNFMPKIKSEIEENKNKNNSKNFKEMLKDIGYTVINNCIHYFKTIKHGEDIESIPVKMCNFVAWIEETETIDKLVESESFHRIVGIREDGTKLPKFSVKTTEFNGMNWIKKWNPKLFTGASPVFKDKIRYCIEMISLNSIETTKYCYTGWKKINNKWFYLYQGGCIGNDENENIEVNLEDTTILRYRLPELKKENLLDDISEVFNLTEIVNGNKNIIYPLIAFTFLAPLKELLSQASCIPRFLYYLVGTTNSGKSSLTCLFLSFFGEFEISGSMPMNFTITKPSFYNYANKLKDILTCIDDYKPDTRNSKRQMDDLAQTAVRAYGDLAIKQKCNSFSQNVLPKIVQGLAILTGEDLPKVDESGFQRMIISEIKKGEVNLEKLTKYQEMASNGTFRNVMRGYLEWLKKNYFDNNLNKKLKNLNIMFKSERTKLNKILIKNNISPRICDNLAHLKIGFRIFLDFFEFVVNDEDIKNYTKNLEKEFDEIILYLAKFNENYTSDEKPTVKFMSIFESLIDRNSIMIRDLDFPSFELPRPGQIEVGYCDAEYYYLNAEVIYNEVCKFCISQGSTFPVSLKTLLKQLGENGMIKIGSDGSHTNRKRISDSIRKRFVFLKKEFINYK